MRYVPVDIRLRAMIVEDPETGCHNWTGATNLKGYGRIGLGGKHLLPHRLAYELAKGPIPDGLVIDHLCRNPACCNPDHLEAVTALENTRRGNSGLRQASRTCCPKGHEYTEENTYRAPSTPRERVCRTCIRARVKSDEQRQRYNDRRSARAAEAVLARGGIPRKKRRLISMSSSSPPLRAAKSDSDGGH